MTSSQKGILLGALSYVAWGLGTLYFKMLSSVPAKEMLSHRIIWSFLLVTFIMLISNRWDTLKKIIIDPQKILLLLGSGSLIIINWFVFIWAVANDHLLEASLGYYINPLLTILLGMILFKDQLSRFQWISVALAFIGVLIQIVIVGKLPWVSLALAVTFSGYSLLRKMAHVDAFAGLMVEMIALFPIAAFYVFFNDNSQTGHFMENSTSFNLLLIMAGVVTTIPLVFFSAAAKRLNLSSLGFLQYITPSMIWLFAVFIYHEPISPSVLITFFFIWAALFCFSLDGIYQHRQVMKVSVSGH